jgi:hypothetical protein
MPHTTTHIEVRRPLLSAECVRAALDIDNSGVAALIHDRSLVAFNIACEIYVKPHVRILSRSLEAHQQGRKLAFDPDAFVRLVFPMVEPQRVGVVITIDVITVSRHFNTKPDLIYQIARNGFFKFVDQARRGPAGSARLEFTSVSAWLKKRLIR